MRFCSKKYRTDQPIHYSARVITQPQALNQFESKPIGLSNSAIVKLCWLNASLTAIAHTPQLRDAILHEYQRIKSIKSGCLPTTNESAPPALPPPPHQEPAIKEAFSCLAEIIHELHQSRTPTLQKRHQLEKAMIKAELIKRPILGLIKKRQDSNSVVKLLAHQFSLTPTGPLSIVYDDHPRNTIELDLTRPIELGNKKSAVAVLIDNPRFSGQVPLTLTTPQRDRWQLRSIIFTHHHHSFTQVINGGLTFYVNEQRVTCHHPFRNKGIPRIIFYDRIPQTEYAHPNELADKSQIPDPKTKN